MTLGVVVIGRNEGERLRRCLESIAKNTNNIVYVDSGSTDGSVTMARSLGSNIVELDMSIPFTAARARNAGSELLHKLSPKLDYVQFVDGDCEMIDGWLEAATEFLDSNANVAMVCGRLKERYPENSIYNLLLDSEWDTPVGVTRTCGGIAMVKATAFNEEGGFRADLIAGEESELCLRLRARGWQIWRLDAAMAWHDAAMTRFGQWWKRTIRTGYAYAEGAHLHGASPERHRLKERRRIWVWGLLIPLFTVALACWSGIYALLILLIYPVQIVRLALKGTKSSKENWLRAIFLVLGKFPEAIGQIKFVYNNLAGKTAKLIEYK